MYEIVTEGVRPVVSKQASRAGHTEGGSSQVPESKEQSPVRQREQPELNPL